MNWLLLIHQIPAKPGYLRAKILRRLQQAGAVAIKQSVYALPDREQCREDLLWIGQEITAGGGEAILVRAELLSGLENQQTAALFRAARRDDYEQIRADARALLAARQDQAVIAESRDYLKPLIKLQKKLARLTTIDFFPPPERAAAEAVLLELETTLRQDAEGGAPPPPEGVDDPADLAGKTWVTRQNVYVDRMASAWLISRRIAPDARFRFTADSRIAADSTTVRFDMADGEYTHQGNQCTFEVLLRRFGLNDPALARLAEVIHDIDLRESTYGRPETDGIKAMFTGIVATVDDDLQRIIRAGTLLDGLLAYYQANP